MSRGRKHSFPELEESEANLSGNPTFREVLQLRVSRRALLRGSAALSSSVILGAGLSSCDVGGQGERAADMNPEQGMEPGPIDGGWRLNFAGIAKSVEDGVSVPTAHSASTLLRLGDPIAPGVAEFRHDGSDSAASFSQRAGDWHDGMHYFGLGDSGHSPEASDRGLLAINHENMSSSYLHAAGPTVSGGVRTSSDEVLKEMYVHGVSIVEVRRSPGGSWAVQRDSAFNRRIHTLTEMQLSGPARATKYMVTRYSKEGVRTRGTINNCACGYTPWGTYLTCEENFAGYFRRLSSTDDPQRTAKERVAFSRYGIAGDGGPLWATVTGPDPDGVYARWDAMKVGASLDGGDDYRNVANSYGWVVEIDPFNPASAPKKRTALGRFAHEGAWLGPVRPGQPLVWYMGDDSRGEYIYKFVSNAGWDPADASGGLSAGDKYLDSGRLFVAKFLSDGAGEWAELSFLAGAIRFNAAYPFEDQADVLINARLAADALGATKMDRPEWGAVNPMNGDVYMSLTNNSTRTLATADPANPRAYTDWRTTGEGQSGNPNGHIVRWAETDGVAGKTFRWDIFLFGARASVADVNINVSGLTAANDFSSPDGLWFSRRGVLWIQTDDGAYTDVTNCMMLACLPGAVGDGAARAILNRAGSDSRLVTTKVGAPMTENNLRRFLVGPRGCEITGIAETPDGKCLFVNIQHPTGSWPDGAGKRPRSSTIVITRNDGGGLGASMA